MLDETFIGSNFNEFIKSDMSDKQKVEMLQRLNNIIDVISKDKE